MSAISGIEMALWDILGKHFGVRSGGFSVESTGQGPRLYHLGLGDMRAVYETMEATPLLSAPRGHRAWL
jgi:galactonate dehydratase